MLTLYTAEINLVVLRRLQSAVTRGQMSKRFVLNYTTQNSSEEFFKRLFEKISVVRSRVCSRGFGEAPTSSGVGSWADTNHLHPMVCPVATETQKDMGPPGLRTPFLASSANPVL